MGSGGSVIHIAGPDIQVGTQLRQRCGWCGALLIDYALDRIAVQVPEDGSEPGGPATWPIGALVEVDGNASWVVDHAAGDPLPDGCCGQLDHEVTA